ncbi:aflatoxin B1 aldehyde reductase member 3 [Trichoderma harzianum]|uniref:Aflatoxin B1 aldehyde reductase member 3 n=1 Tax=Trichoderma harzianum TaxID=5544 RepID=A0A0G0ALS6_TRIHA|nr:aflatoxin B1 aldehyde reductase member 3 [Trichoderma harzianum]
MSAQYVSLAIGAHTWTPDNIPEVEGLLQVMRKHGIKIIDTARSYGLGASETTIGLKKLAGEFAIDTKAATGIAPGSGHKILEFAKESLEALQTNKDEDTPVDVQMEAIQTLYKQGAFETFGVSNFTPEQVIEFYNYAKSKGYILPTVYQSSYSLAVRQNETRLFPTLRKLDISIQAYSPMAGGLLSKTPEYIEAGKGNWDPNTITGKVFRDLYYKPSYLKMLEEFGKLSAETGISRSGLAYRWVRYHSALKSELGDQMILGSVNAQQLEEAMGELNKGPLEAETVEKLESLWQLIKDDAPIDNLISVRKVVRGSA